MAFMFAEKAPNNKFKERFREIFGLTEPIGVRFSKEVFDKTLGLISLSLLSPLFTAIFVAYLIDGLLCKENAGWPFIVYIASSQGRPFKKYKFRLGKDKFVDQKLRSEFIWDAFPPEKPAYMTAVGKFLKRYYLDELPQIFNVIKGQMSIVGPRPMAWKHYEWDIRRGHVNRMLLRAGVFSATHVRKGTPLWGKVELDYEYIEKYRGLPWFLLAWEDFKIISLGVMMILRGRGLRI